MNKLPLIITREFLAKIRNRTFIIMTFISPLLMILLIGILVYVSKKSMDKKREISYIDESGLFGEEVFQSTATLVFHNLTGTPLDQAIEAVRQTGQYGLLYIPRGDKPEDVASDIRFYSEKSPGLTFTERLENLLGKELTLVKMKEMQLDVEKYRASKVKVNLNFQSYEGKESSKFETGLKFGIGSAAGYFIFLFIMVYGAMVMRSVIEEKTSRIIEVIVSSVKPFQLLLGKVLGTALAALLQFAIWGVLFMVLYSLALYFLGIDASSIRQGSLSASGMDTPDAEKFAQLFSTLSTLPAGYLLFTFILFFTGGYLLYSALFAAIGAAVDNETDTQQFMTPLMLPLILAIYIGIAVAADDPHGSIATLFSMIPFTSPIVMMVRIPLGAPVWQVLVSLVILFVTITGTVWVAAKIYRAGILSYGNNPSFKQLYKWLKY